MVKPRLSKSGVSWTDYSWGIVDGCTKVSEACKNCYAEGYANRFWANQIVQENKPSVEGDLNPLERRRKFTDVFTHPERLQAPLNTKKGGKVFVAPMGDLFHPDVPFDFIDKVFLEMVTCHWHTFQILTKRPERMLEYYKSGLEYSEVMDWAPPKNVWLGVTAENQEQADKRIPILLQIPAAVRFVSVEPMLGPVNIADLVSRPEVNELDCRPVGSWHIDWVICGGESGSNARPMHPDWARSLRDQCTATGVKFFFKQWGEYSSEVVQGTKVDVRELKGNQYVAWGDGKTYHIRYTKVGTKKAGNLLDGQTWQQMPEVA